MRADLVTRTCVLRLLASPRMTAENHSDLALADLSIHEEHAVASLPSLSALYADATFSAQSALPDDAAGTLWRPVAHALPEAGFFAHGVVAPCDLVGDGEEDAAFLSALAVVATRAELVLALIVSADHVERGILTLRFHKHGGWRHVTIDTTVPCTADGEGLRFARAATRRECWPSLFLKGYAKLHGSCAARDSGAILPRSRAQFSEARTRLQVRGGARRGRRRRGGRGRGARRPDGRPAVAAPPTRRRRRRDLGAARRCARPRRRPRFA